MSEVSFVADAERDAYRAFDRQRRQRLLIGIGLALGSFGIVYLAAFNLLLIANPMARQPSIFVVDGTSALATLSLFAAALLARRNLATTATVTLVLALFVGVSALIIAFATTHGLTELALTGLGAYLMVIALAAALGAWWLIPLTTLASSLASIALLLALANPALDPGAKKDIQGQLALLIPQTLTQQWVVAAVLVFVSLAYRRTLRELGDTRVAMERAQKLDDLKSQFITSVNHELRTPMMALISNLQLLETQVERQAAYAEIHRVLLRASHVGEGVIQLLNSILDARRLDVSLPAFQPAPVVVHTVFASALEMIDPREGNLSERALRAHIPDDLVIWGDATRLQQILTNLLSNAIKYSSPGSPILVSASRARDVQKRRTRWGGGEFDTREMVEIMVRDFGLGIPPDEIPLLFQRFTRLPRDLASTVIGNGLGLYLCRVFAEAMDGRIWVESAGVAGQGSTFYVRLPTPPAQREPVAAPEERTPLAQSAPVEG